MEYFTSMYIYVHLYKHSLYCYIYIYIYIYIYMYSNTMNAYIMAWAPETGHWISFLRNQIQSFLDMQSCGILRVAVCCWHGKISIKMPMCFQMWFGDDSWREQIYGTHLYNCQTKIYLYWFTTLRHKVDASIYWYFVSWHRPESRTSITIGYL